MASQESKDDVKVAAMDLSTTETIDWGKDDSVIGQVVDVDGAYLSSSRFTRLFRSVLFQMILFGAISFVGPSMSDAISNLGGGGLSSPYLANLASALNYAAGCLVTLIGGPLINKIGIKYACLLATLTFPLDGSSYYVNARYGTNWYLLFSKLLGGFSSGFLYVGETTAMLSYPTQDERGFYLGIWSAMRNSGSIIGGGINFATNYTNSNGGGIRWSTYLIFVGFECTGIFWASLLSKTKRVRRRDGSYIPTTGDVSWKSEFSALWKHVQRKKTWFVFLPAFYSFFYGGTMGTYLSRHFSVRARALSSLITPSITIPMVIAYGQLLDWKRWSQTQRAWIAFSLWVIPQSACLIWIGIEYSKFGTAKATLDYGTESRRWAEAYLPYLIIFTTGYWTQLSLYWILGTFSTDTAGQAVSYSINSHTGSDARIPFYVNSGILVMVIPSMIMLIGLIPEQPASVDVDAGEVVKSPENGVLKEENLGKA